MDTFVLWSSNHSFSLKKSFNWCKASTPCTEGYQCTNLKTSSEKKKKSQKYFYVKFLEVFYEVNNLALFL